MGFLKRFGQPETGLETAVSVRGGRAVPLHGRSSLGVSPSIDNTYPVPDGASLGI